MSAYQALIFDLGKVVFDLSFDRVFEFWAKASGRGADELKSAFRFDGVFDEFEKDGITPAVFRAEISTRLGLTLPDQVFDAGWCALYLDVYPGIDRLLARLKQHYRLVALTNTNCLHSEVWRTRYAGTLRHFQRVFCSHELQARKPEAPAYQAVLDYLQVKPEQVVFLDDSPENLNGAARLGLKTILVTSAKQLTTELQTMGVLA